MDSDNSSHGDPEMQHEDDVKSLKSTSCDNVEECNNDEETQSYMCDSESAIGKDRAGFVPMSESSDPSNERNEDVWDYIPTSYSEESDLKVPTSAKHKGNEGGEIIPEERDCHSTGVSEERLSYHVVERSDSLDNHVQNEELSYISDVESNDGLGTVVILSDNRAKNGNKNDSVANVGKRKQNESIEEMEQLDFEAEELQEKDEKEEGEYDFKDDKSDEGELEGDDLEEGELADEDENRPEETEPRPVCRFYSRGQCTWGSSCRFIHPGVTDKGNYTMFEMVRPLVPANGLSSYASTDYRSSYEKPSFMGMLYPSPVKEEPVVIESAWERGLRQAKEMMRKSSQRKETDMDFEEKKMNLSLGQEELDKENDYYIRSASPVYKEDEQWNMEMESYCYRDEMITVDPYEDISELYYHRPRGTGRDYWRHVHYEPEETRTVRLESDYVSCRRERSSNKNYSHHQRKQTSPEFYDKYDKKSSRQKSHTTRIVSVEQAEKHRREDRHADVSLSNRRGDEWADPWMRSKSPVGRKGTGHVTRRRSRSSGHSSTGCSRSSSQSSRHSVNHNSRSRVQSKKCLTSQSSSRNIVSHTHRKPNRPLLPTPRPSELSSPPVIIASSQKGSKHLTEPRDFGRNKTHTSSFAQSEKKAANERALLMNPPPPSPQRPKEIPPHSPAMMRKSAQNPPPPPASPARSNSSVSSSDSDSSGSSSDSSETSCSSSSSSQEPSPKVVCPPKRLVMEERGRLAMATENLKVKAMDALKLSGQKQQIKLTLKTSVSVPNKTRTVSALPDLPQLNLVRKDRVLPTIIGKKRQIENVLSAESAVAAKITSMPKPAQKNVTSRREELLKQLKAVEDAIARKRSKI